MPHAISTLEIQMQEYVDALRSDDGSPEATQRLLRAQKPVLYPGANPGMDRGMIQTIRLKLEIIKASRNAKVAQKLTAIDVESKAIDAQIEKLQAQMAALQRKREPLTDLRAREKMAFDLLPSLMASRTFAMRVMYDELIAAGFTEATLGKKTWK